MPLYTKKSVRIALSNVILTSIWDYSKNVCVDETMVLPPFRVSRIFSMYTAGHETKMIQHIWFDCDLNLKKYFKHRPRGKNFKRGRLTIMKLKYTSSWLYIKKVFSLKWPTRLPFVQICQGWYRLSFALFLKPNQAMLHKIQCRQHSGCILWNKSFIAPIFVIVLN